MKAHRVATWLRLILVASLTLVLQAHAQSGDRAGQLTEEFHQTYPLSADGTVELSNINGPVHITAWDRSEVKIDAVKYARRKERLHEAKIVVDSTPNSISIRTEYPNHDHTFNDDDQNNPAGVEYTLLVPRGASLDEIKLINGSLDIHGTTARVHASCINGKLTANGLSGDLRLSTINGKLFAELDRLADHPIELSSVNGSIDLMIPSDSKADVEATSMSGSIADDFGLQEHHHLVGHNLRGELGGGGTKIKLRNVNGMIEVHHNSDGRPLSPATDFNSSDRDHDDI